MGEPKCAVCMDTGDYPIMNSRGKELYVVDCPECNSRRGVTPDSGAVQELVEAANRAFEFLGGVDDAAVIRGNLLEALAKLDAKP